MSDVDNTILHETATREVIEDEIAEAITEGDIPVAETVIEDATTAVMVALLSAQQPNITDASEAHALNAVFDDTEVEAALNALGGKINDILAVFLAYGFIDVP
jgi:hypothetical protein